MLIERISIAEGERIAEALAERHTLAGTYFLLPDPKTPSRYFMTSADGNEGEFTVMTGRDPKRGWITLLQNTTEAILILKATTAPLV